jgi:hypothetical protein
LIFDGAKASHRGQTAGGLIGKNTAVQQRFRRCDREIGTHELSITELETWAGRKGKGVISLDEIEFDVAVEALGAADPLACLQAGAEEVGRPEFQKAAKFGCEADIMQAEEIVVVADASETAAEGALGNKARDRTSLDPREVEERDAKSIVGRNKWLGLARR